MTQYVMSELNVDRDRADYLRGHYWERYGTTLSGLMREHDLDPIPYLHAVHDIDFSVLSPDPALAMAIRALPGRKIVYTNGSAPYAQKVLKGRGLDGLMDAVYGVEHADFHPKPEATAFQTVFSLADINSQTSAMFEDDVRNLAVPHQLNMRTVHVADAPIPAPHIGYHTNDLTDFLSQVA
jgi:putative hydrolase of the HAD superfamily